MIGKIVFQDWIVESLIGQGSFGSVYKISKEKYGVQSKAALKILSVPQTDSDFIDLLNEGMDENSATNYLEGVVNDIVREISIMSQLKGHPNIVGCDDYQVIPKPNSVGWDIYIKMELLSSLVEYQLKNGFTVGNVVKLGIELTDALGQCHRQGLIHRDIKPGNIFVNEYGVYKIGDFGVARNVENSVSVKSKKGTEVYMAPEVYLGKRYDASVDLYSLGIVLYKCLNNNRLPFLPDVSKQIKPGDREVALVKRMEGNPIPRPAHGDDELVRIVLKAIAYNPTDRYLSAQEMHADLSRYMTTHQAMLSQYVLASLRSKTDTDQKGTLVDDIRIYQHDNISSNVSIEQVNVPPKKPNKSKKAIAIVAGIVAALVLIGGGIALVTSGVMDSSDKTVETTSKTKNKKPTKTPTPKPSSTPSPTTTPSPTPEETSTPTPTAAPTEVPEPEEIAGYDLADIGGWDNVSMLDDGTYEIILNIQSVTSKYNGELISVSDYGWYYDYKSDGTVLIPKRPNSVSFDGRHSCATYDTEVSTYKYIFAYLDNNGTNEPIIIGVTPAPDAITTIFLSYEITGYYESDDNWQINSELKTFAEDALIRLAINKSEDGTNFNMVPLSDDTYNPYEVDCANSDLWFTPIGDNSTVDYRVRYMIKCKDGQTYFSDWLDIS